MYVHVCMLTGLCVIILLAMRFVCALGPAFCYICLFICFICCILSLLNCTELPTWLLGWFTDLLITWLLTSNGRVGWLSIWLTGYAGAVLHHVANHRLLSLRLVRSLNTEIRDEALCLHYIQKCYSTATYLTFPACAYVTLTGP